MRSGTPTIAFMRREWRFLLFGALIIFWTSPGQTFLISLFGDQLRQDFNLSHSEFGGIYTAATLTSAAILWPAGRLVDRLPLAKFVWWTCAAMVAGSLAFSRIEGPITLFLGILVVRFLGQGMMSHIAVTAMARRYVAERGRAIAIAGFGFPIAEGALPPLITIGLTLTSWQNIWIGLAVVAALTLLPTVPFLLKRTSGQDGQGFESLAKTGPAQKQWTRSEMLRDSLFFKIAPQIMAMSAIFTGLIFHQKFIIATVKEWDFLWWSLGFSLFAVFHVFGSFLAGWLVDRISARRITPFVLLPFAASTLILGFGEHPYWVPVIMCLMGTSAGTTGPTYSSLWAELYGTQHLGAIRAAGAVLSVFGSALGPVVIGWTLDAEVSIATITLTSVLITLLASALAAAGLRDK
ncbi:MAG: MFS transporter [Rhodospirillales bacterium]|nr:MFS transporter [Rhodospirillales bacterium]